MTRRQDIGVGQGQMNTIPKLAIITVALGLGSCGIDSAPRVVPVAWPYVTKDGRYVALRVGDGLGGWGCGFDYTLVRIDNHTADFCRWDTPSRNKTVRVGDRLKIRSFHGDINATILAIEDDVVRVLIPEQPFIIERGPTPSRAPTEVTSMKQFRVPSSDLPHMPNKTSLPTGSSSTTSTPAALP
jgi:hypothetical protein